MNTTDKFTKIILWVETIVQGYFIFCILGYYIRYRQGQQVDFLPWDILSIALFGIQSLSAIFHIAGNRGRMPRILFFVFLFIYILIEMFGTVDYMYKIFISNGIAIYYFSLTGLLHFKKSEK